MLEYATLTNSGDRPYNEDYIAYGKKRDTYCFVLADGLGGHDAGDVASKLVAETIVQGFVSINQFSKPFIGSLIENAQSKLLEEQNRSNRCGGMKTTCVVLCVNSDNAVWGHVGDSRLYHFTSNQFIHTDDHSVPWMLYKSGEISKKEIRNHPDRNRLTAVMGIEWQRPRYKLMSNQIINKDAFLLCSDGFWEYIDEETMIREKSKSRTPKEWLSNMGKIVLENGKNSNMDNYSAVAIFVHNNKKTRTKRTLEEPQSRNKKKNLINKSISISKLLIVTALLTIISVILGAFYFKSDTFQYNQATRLLDQEQLNKAQYLFELIPEFKDSSEKYLSISTNKLQRAKQLRQENDLIGAKQLEYEVFQSSKNNVDERYILANYYLEIDSLYNAYYILFSLGNYEDSFEKRNEIELKIFSQKASGSGVFGGIINNEGMLEIYGMQKVDSTNSKNYAEKEDEIVIYEQDTYDNIKSIACGDTFMLILDYKETVTCSSPSYAFREIDNVKKICAESSSFMVLKQDGTVAFGSKDKSVENTWHNIINVDVGNGTYAALSNEGKVTAYSETDDYINSSSINKWEDVVNIAVGGENIFGLNIHGQVYFYSPDEENGEIHILSEKFSDLKEMSACADYLVAIDNSNTLITNKSDIDLDIELADIEIGCTQWLYEKEYVECCQLSGFDLRGEHFVIDLNSNTMDNDNGE